jgi:hypothetical protein
MNEFILMLLRINGDSINLNTPARHIISVDIIFIYYE